MEDSLVGPKLKQRRNELNLSLRALAAETGLSAAFLSQIERGKSNPSLNSLQRIAKALNVSFYYFLSTNRNAKKRQSELNEGIN
jgi:transcriptional regulator with XRE-family HTH domain